MTSHNYVRRGQRGFTIVELVVVIVLIGILGAIGASRFFDRTGFDADSFTEQVRSMLRYAQKIAIAQRRPVFVRFDGNSIALCFTNAPQCAPADRVQAPGGSNSGSRATRQNCAAAAWYCEGRPADIEYAVAGPAVFSFDALGSPQLPPGSPAVIITISGGGQASVVNVIPETGYVF